MDLFRVIDLFYVYGVWAKSRGACRGWRSVKGQLNRTKPNHHPIAAAPPPPAPPSPTTKVVRPAKQQRVCPKVQSEALLLLLLFMNKKFCGYGCGLWFNCFYGNTKKNTQNHRKQQTKNSKSKKKKIIIKQESCLSEPRTEIRMLLAKKRSWFSLETIQAIG